jgi:hypothetical protein
MSSIICNRNGVIEVSLVRSSRRDGAGPKESTLNSHAAGNRRPTAKPFSPTVVWVNTKSNVYHFAERRDYGDTK